jgi:hypothetical protein
MTTPRCTRGFTISVGLLCMSLSWPVLSQGPAAGGPGPGLMPAYSDFDLNKDGKVTEEEFNEARAARIADRAQKGYPMRGLANAESFDAMDANRDGVLSPEEFAAHQNMQRRPPVRQQ